MNMGTGVRGRGSGCEVDPVNETVPRKRAGGGERARGRTAGYSGRQKRRQVRRPRRNQRSMRERERVKPQEERSLKRRAVSTAKADEKPSEGRTRTHSPDDVVPDIRQVKDTGLLGAAGTNPAGMVQRVEGRGGSEL